MSSRRSLRRRLFVAPEATLHGAMRRRRLLVRRLVLAELLAAPMSLRRDPCVIAPTPEGIKAGRRGRGP